MYYEDITVGQTHEFGEQTVTEEEILEFGEQYDPQPFHVDRDAARESMFGGLIASGWHTAAICMRLLVDGFLSESKNGGGSGVDELRWHRPVRPGDTLTLRTEILEKHSSEDVPSMGHARMRLTGINQNDETVISFVLQGMIGRREFE